MQFNSFSKNDYETTQDLNCITKFLHSTRYKNLIHIALSLNSNGLRVLDIGAGTARAYEVLNARCAVDSYTALEVDTDFIELNHSRHGKNTNFNCISAQELTISPSHYDLIIGLESFEHMTTEAREQYIQHIKKCDFKYLYITVPNEIGPAIMIKNVGSWLMGYIRHEEYYFRETVFASMYRLDKVRPHQQGHRGFDYRALRATLNDNFHITKVYKSPTNYIPLSFSPSVGFLCVKR